jgi:hydroxyethylthiazole kinase-like uncharacterized protein yjeF
VRVLTAEQMKTLDLLASRDAGASELMRRAGTAIASLIPTLTQGRALAGLAGPGNNGGDVFAAFAELDASYGRTVLEIAPAEQSDARRNARERARAAGVRIVPAESGEGILEASDLCLDGLLGVGSRLPLTPGFLALAQRLGAHQNVLAIDLPTGIDATTGVAAPGAIAARATLTLGALKLGLFAEAARPYVGQLWFDDLGMGHVPIAGAASALTENEAARLMPLRAEDADKRASGAPLIVAGSEQFPGAAVLCARAAARAGAGYVTVAAPLSAAPVLRAQLVEQVVVTFDDRDPAGAIETITGLSNHCSSIALGPGLGLSDPLGEIVRGVISASALPMVIDAGALFHLAKRLDVIEGKRVVLTPHAGEFARLSGKGTLAAGTRIDRLRDFVSARGSVTLLKGQTTLIADRARLALNASGTNALATAGTGDVLSGIIATLLSQKLEPFEAATLGAFWHGLAGQVAHSWRPVGVMAGDVIESLADAAPQHGDEHGLPLRIF